MSEIARLEELFQEAADLPQDERAGFLDAADLAPTERARLDAMLADLESGETLERGAAMEPVGARVGRFRILEVLGEGGFGVVYRAEQRDPVRREVALKILKPGMDSREVVARFEAERQALAMMDHEAIARVLDGGVTPTGRPYFVLELVRGRPLTEHCDREGLDVPSRLDLFLRVCEAVQHAHLKGIVHRDLKPSNVLVAVEQGRPVPKVIDFGVAKALHGRLTDKTLFTGGAVLLGTPAYMSPEQAEPGALDVDVRADVYSLGVLLYELLTGTTPIRRETLSSAPFSEVRRILREEPPERPSARVRGSSGRREGSEGGGGQAQRAARAQRLAGDLDWIVLRALEKERSRRYQSAGDFAEDLRRHLRDEPVLARPPSVSYRLGKLVRRHRAAAIGTVVAALGLLGGLLGTAVGLIEASKQRDVAQREATRAGAVTDFLVEALALGDPEVVLGPVPSVRDVLDRAAVRLDGAFPDQPRAEARLRSTLGRAYESLTEHARAEHHLRRAVDLSDRYGGVGPRERYDTLWALTHVLFRLERPDAHAVAHRAREVAIEWIAARDPEVAEAIAAQVSEIRSGVHHPDPEPVRRAFVHFAAAEERAEEAWPEGHPAWPVLADTAMDAAYSLWYTRHEALAVPFLERALAIRRRELPPHHADTGETMTVLAGVLARAGRPEEAEARLRETVRRLEEVFVAEGFQVAFARSMLGENLAAQGRFEEAEALLLASHEALLEGFEDEATFFPIDSYVRVIGLYDAWGRPAEALPFRRELASIGSRATWALTWPFGRAVFGPETGRVRAVGDAIDAELGRFEYTVAPGGRALEDSETLEHLRTWIAEADERLADEDPRRTVAARQLLAWANALEPGDAVRLEMAEAFAESLDPRELPMEAAELAAIRARFTDSESERARRLAEARECLTDVGTEISWHTANQVARVGRAHLDLGEEQAGREVLERAAEVLRIQLGESSQDLAAVRSLLAR